MSTVQRHSSNVHESLQDDDLPVSVKTFRNQESNIKCEIKSPRCVQTARDLHDDSNNQRTEAARAYPGYNVNRAPLHND